MAAKHYERGAATPAFIFNGNELYIYPDLSYWMNGIAPVATWGGTHSALIDEKAFDIILAHCGDDEQKLRAYMRAITEFEIHHSDDEERHLHRTPIEQEILDILTDGGYFEQPRH